ncbi:MAG: hypothetical protein CM1200mP30_30830 [Pseudomonadota bacterium]|nr:MAG: hypothetical protein CM1200mP30_30830 [Pseudomonadota bacterium]
MQNGELLPGALKVSTITKFHWMTWKKANRLLQEEIIYKFITTKTNMELSYKNLRNIFELLLSENKHWEYSLSEEWKLVNSGNELSLKNEPKS